MKSGKVNNMKILRTSAVWMKKKYSGKTRRWFFLPWLRVVIGVFPFTKTGIAFLALFGVAVGVHGLRRMDFILLAAGLAGVLTIIVLLLCTLTGATLLFFASRRAATPGVLDLVTNLRQSTGCRVSYPAWLPCAIARWSWVDAAGMESLIYVERENGRLTETVRPVRRCVTELVTRRFFVRDIFGLTDISWCRAETVNLRVLPDRGLFKQIPPPIDMFDGDDVPDPWAAPSGDRVDMRPYVPGDPLRMVLWKVFARSGRMMVRTPERSATRLRRGCGYLVTGTGDDAAAAAACVAVERGLLGADWRFGAGGVRNHAAETNEALEMIARSGTAEGQTGELGDFLAKAGSDGYQSCVLFVPPDPKAWDYVVRETRGGSMRMRVIIGVESVRPERKGDPGFTQRAADWFLRSETGGAPTLEEIRRMVAVAPGLSLTVGIAERQTGRMFTIGSLSKNGKK